MNKNKKTLELSRNGFGNRIWVAIFAVLILLDLILLPMSTIGQGFVPDFKEGDVSYNIMNLISSPFGFDIESYAEELLASAGETALTFEDAHSKAVLICVVHWVFAVAMAALLVSPVLMLLGALLKKRTVSVVGGFMGTLAPVLAIVAVIVASHPGYVFAANLTTLSIGFWVSWLLSIISCVLAYVDRSVLRRGKATDSFVHIFLVCIAVIWLVPFVWLIGQSFRAESQGLYTPTFFPKEFGLQNFAKLFTDTETINFPRMFMNTLVISCFTCVISTFFVLSVSYCTSRVKWKMRKPYMNMAMVINLFPGFMSMVAIYFLLKAMGLTEGDKLPIALVICYCAGAGTGFYVMKGYMDTIPKALDEAAYLDGATKWQTFTKITLPLCKPMIVYQIITSFMGPWMDFIFAKIIVRTEVQYYTVSIGLYRMLEMEYVGEWFTAFCAGAVLVAIPISVLFIITQKFYQEAMSGSVKG